MTQTERLILSLLYTVLEKLDPDEAQSYSTRRTIVEEGFTRWYSSLNAAIDPEEFSDEVQQEVYEILDMHRALKNGLDALGQDAGINPEDIDFRGFDGNNEPEHLSFGRFLTSQDLYEESPVENSHMMVLGIYGRQLEAWNACADRNHLTQEDIEAIIKAKLHPENE